MQISKYNLIAASLFIYSLYLKLNKLYLVEFKYDQQFGLSVLKSCSENNYFSYIKGSTGLPQGAFHYIFECLGGILGVESYIEIVIFDIILSQISLFFIYKIIAKNVSEITAVSSISLVLFNPYLIISARNISSAQHFEFFFLIYLYLFFNLNKLKYGVLKFSLYSSISLIIYFPVFIYFSTFLVVIYYLDKNRKTFQYIFGYFTGLVINFISYIPYILEYGIPSIRNASGSWGISSYWKIYLDILSSSSIQIKINNPIEFQYFVNEYPYINELFSLNKFILFGIMAYFIFVYIAKIYKNSIKIDLSLLTFISITLSGFVFTFLDRPLFAHYFFTIVILCYTTFLQNISKKVFILTICIVLNFSNILIYNNFISFVEANNGIPKSDYGIIYSECGCCVIDARQCRGQ